MARTLMACSPRLFRNLLESLGKNPIATDFGKFRMIFLFYNKNRILCVLVRIASMR